jgi:hypothetical protein
VARALIFPLFVVVDCRLHSVSTLPHSDRILDLEMAVGNRLAGVWRGILLWAVGLAFLFKGVSNLRAARSALQARDDSSSSASGKSSSSTDVDVNNVNSVSKGMPAPGHAQHSDELDLPFSTRHRMNEHQQQSQAHLPTFGVSTIALGRAPRAASLRGAELSAQATTTASRGALGQPSSSDRRGLMLVTACSESHLCALMQLLASLKSSADGTPIIVYDLNPPPGPHMQLNELRRAYEHVVAVRLFPYDEHPPYFNVLKRAGHWACESLLRSSIILTNHKSPRRLAALCHVTD